MDRLSEQLKDDLNELIPCISEIEQERIDKAISRFKTYEDAEEQGLLVRLPCKAGDTVYVLESEGEDGGEERLFRGTIASICIRRDQIDIAIGCMEPDCWFSSVARRLSDIGVDWFLSREEADKVFEEANQILCRRSGG